MATLVLQRVCHLGHHRVILIIYISNFCNLFLAKIQQIFLKLVENVCLQPHKQIQLRME